MIPRKISQKKLLLLIGDIIIIILSFFLGSIIRFGHVSSFKFPMKNPIILFFILFSYVFCLYVFNLYDIRGKFLTSLSLFSFFGTLTAVGLLAILIFYLFPYAVGRGIFLISYLLVGVLAFLWRVFFTSFLRIAIPRRKILIICRKKGKQAFSFLSKYDPEYEIVGFLSDAPSRRNADQFFPYLGAVASLEKVVDAHKIDDIIITEELRRKKNLEKALVNCRMKGINIFDFSTFYEYLMNKIPVFSIKDQWLLYSHGFDKLGSNVYKRVKRGFDLIVSIFLLTIILPLFFIISLLIKFTSKGPFLYFQERLGENEKPYKIYKFRTMVIEAEREEPKWAEENDSRVTAVGKVLRKTRLDELPQLINVLKGDMSMIGPRPEREYFIRQLKKKIPYYSLRFAVKPGITGWAQVNYRYGATVDDAIEKLQYDLYYIKNMSLFLDLRILLKTVRVSLFGMGR